jgi:hypothetical protein
VATNTAAKAGDYAQRLLDNEYVQENLGEAVANLRAAYRRVSKRRVKPATDQRLRGQLRQAAASLAEAASALRSGRREPKKRRGRRVIIALGVAAGAAAALLAANEALRNKVFGGDSPLEAHPAQAPASSESEVTAVA